MDFSLFCRSLHQTSIVPLQDHLKRANWLSYWKQGVPGKHGLPESALIVRLIVCEVKLVLRFSLQPDETVLVKYLEVFGDPKTGRPQARNTIDLGTIANCDLPTGEHLVEMFREIIEREPSKGHRAE